LDVSRPAASTSISVENKKKIKGSNL